MAAGTPASDEAATDDGTGLKSESTQKPCVVTFQVVDVVVIDPQSLGTMSSRKCTNLRLGMENMLSRVLFVRSFLTWRV